MSFPAPASSTPTTPVPARDPAPSRFPAEILPPAPPRGVVLDRGLAWRLTLALHAFGRSDALTPAHAAVARQLVGEATAALGRA